MRGLHVSTHLLLLVAPLFSLALKAGESIDGQSAPDWKPQPAWSPGKAASTFSVTGRDGNLAFRARDGVMTWTFAPRAQHLAGGKRFLLLRYRAQGVPSTGDYLLIGLDGSPGWRHYLTQRDLQADGAEHTLAVDLLAFLPPDQIEQLALRVSPLPGQTAELEASLTCADAPPPGAKVHGLSSDRKSTRLQLEAFDWQACPSWVPQNAATAHRLEKTAASLRLQVQGAGRAMRWRATAPPPVDVQTMPFFAVRYRATGPFAPGGYILQTDVLDSQGERKSAHLLTGRDLDADGAWHVFRRRLDERGTAAGLAAGIDCGNAASEIEIDWIAFESHPLAMPVAELLDFQPLDQPWPAGSQGFTPLEAPSNSSHRLGPLALARFGFGDWFPTSHIQVAGVPFQVPDRLESVLASGLAEEDALAVDLPAGPLPQEILLLLGAEFPHREFTLHTQTSWPLHALSEPERLVCALEYADGTVDEFLPIHAGKGQPLVGHGLALYAVRPAPSTKPRRLVLRDRMTNAAFAILGVTLNHEAPRIPEPAVAPLPDPPARKAPSAPATFEFSRLGGLCWDSIHSPLFGEPVALAGEPVFSLRLENRLIPSTDWTIREAVSSPAEGFRADCVWEDDGLSLSARFSAKPVDARSVQLSLELRNAGKAPLTGTLLFPQLAKLALGPVEDTWYLACRTGGIINRVPCAWRDEIGEPHALPLDGFFNPRLGAGLALLPRDLEGVFRWYCVGKDDRGGNYALEFLPQTVAPGESWTCVPVVMAAVAGDWRDQLALYRDWASTWYRPSAPRKDWFARTVGVPSFCPTEPFNRPLDERVDLLGQAKRIEQALGYCDYLHLFGWAITPDHGHWGAYDEYQQLGGRETFAAQIRKCREAGVPTGLYLDGYLVSTRAAKPSREQQESWSIRTADGKMLYHPSYDAHSMCPHAAGWREHLVSAYRRVAAETQPSGMYLDEFGKCMTGRACWASTHGHPVPMGMSAGEWLLSRQIRAAIPPATALYCEYVPADVGCQYLDGAYGHTALDGFRDGYDQFSPSYINLQRFALPDFKIFELTYYAPLKNGNWFLLKYPFFNGEGYYMTSYYWKGDAHATGFLRQALRVLHSHADAFASPNVEPLVPTLAPGLFANRFSTPEKSVWTLFNATSRTLRGPLLSVPHPAGARYADEWSGQPVAFTPDGTTARLSLTLGPRQVGCVAQFHQPSP